MSQEKKNRNETNSCTKKYFMDKPNKKAKITAVQEPKKVLSKLHTHTHTQNYKN